MRIKINDKIYRLKEIESGVDSLMELVEEPQYKDGDFLVKEYKDGAQYIFILDYIDDKGLIYYHCYYCNRFNATRVKDDFGIGSIGDAYHKRLRYATDSEKELLIAELYKVGKRWNEERKCVEDIPKRKFNVGDKVVLKSGYKKSDGLIYLDVFDLFIGRKITVAGYTDVENVHFYDCPYIFEEDWLEPYVEELKEGDLAIFWDNVSQRYASVRIFGRLAVCGYFDITGVRWDNAIKFESKEQYEKLIKGEILK
jgi:hypothetical protein